MYQDFNNGSLSERLHNYLLYRNCPVSIGEICGEECFASFSRREVAKALQNLANTNDLFRSMESGRAYYSVNSNEGGKNAVQKNIDNLQSALNGNGRIIREEQVSDLLRDFVPSIVETDKETEARDIAQEQDRKRKEKDYNKEQKTGTISALVRASTEDAYMIATEEEAWKRAIETTRGAALEKAEDEAVPLTEALKEAEAVRNNHYDTVSKIKLSYNHGILGNSEKYTMRIPDGFKVLEGEDRDFAYYLPDEECGDPGHALIKILPVNGDINIEIPMEYRLQKSYAVYYGGVGFLSSREKKLSMLFDDAKFMATEYGACYITMMLDSRHYYFIIYCGDAYKQIHLQFDGLSGTNEDFDQKAQEIIKGVAIKEPLKELEKLNKEEFLPDTITTSLVNKWCKALDENNNEYHYLYNTEIATEKIRMEFEQGEGRFSLIQTVSRFRSYIHELCQNIDRMCSEIIDFWEKLKKRTCNDELLVVVYRAIKKFSTDNAEFSITFNGEEMKESPMGLRDLVTRIIEKDKAIEVREIAREQERKRKEEEWHKEQERIQKEREADIIAASVRALTETAYTQAAEEEAWRKAIEANREASLEEVKEEAVQMAAPSKEADEVRKEIIEKNSGVDITEEITKYADGESWEDVAKAEESAENHAVISAESVLVEQEQITLEERLSSAQNAIGQIKNLLCVDNESGAIAVVTLEGRVYTIGLPLYLKNIVESWTDIKQISMRICPDFDREYVVGLKWSGTVLFAGKMADYSVDLSSWKNIKQIDCGWSEILGLTENGTVLAVGDSKYGCLDVENWKDIKHVIGGIQRSIGLKTDGTVVECGRSHYWGITEKPASDNYDIIIDNLRSSSIYGLTKAGTVHDPFNGNNNISDLWENIVSISPGIENECSIFGVTENGHVLVDTRGKEKPKYKELRNWSNIAYIAGGKNSIVAITKDGYLKGTSGTVLPPSVSGIKLFDDYKENLYVARKRALEEAERKRIDALKYRITALENELQNTRGLFSGFKKKRLQNEIDELRALI